MAVARLKRSLGGGSEQRAAAYAELTALAHGDAPDATTGLSTATLRVGALADAGLEDEAKLAERLGAFGTVLAVTLRHEERGSWALVTYAEAAESERALEGAAAELDIESAQVRRMDTQQALGGAGAAGETMHEQRRRVGLAVAVACVGPLVEAVLCADISDVVAEEFQRASLVLGSLCWMDNVDFAVMVEYFRGGRFSAVWQASGNALNTAAAKDPAELTRDDAMT